MQSCAAHWHWACKKAAGTLPWINEIQRGIGLQEQRQGWDYSNIWYISNENWGEKTNWIRLELFLLFPDVELAEAAQQSGEQGAEWYRKAISF